MKTTTNWTFIKTVVFMALAHRQKKIPFQGKSLQYTMNANLKYFILISIFLSFFLLSTQYAQETQHEKILRGLAVGIAFTMYARLEEADPLVTSLTTDKDPVLRRSGMYTLAMAYCGTGSNKAIRKLLHIAVSKIELSTLWFFSLPRIRHGFGRLTTKNEFTFFIRNFQLARSDIRSIDLFFFLLKLDHDSFRSCLKIEKLWIHSERNVSYPEKERERKE